MSLPLNEGGGALNRYTRIRNQDKEDADETGRLIINPKVINLSSRDLLSAETSIPRPEIYTYSKRQWFRLAADINEFCHKLRLNDIFFDDETQEKEGPLVRNKTGWQQPKSKDKSLEETINMITTYPLEIYQKPSNLSKGRKYSHETTDLR